MAFTAQKKRNRIQKQMITPKKSVAIWLNYLGDVDRSTKTIMRYKGVLRRFLAWHENEEQQSMQFTDLTPIALMSYRAYLQKNWATATVNVHVAALRAWCQWLVQNKYLVENPAANLKLVRQVQGDAPEPLSNTAVNALLREVRRGRHGKRDYVCYKQECELANARHFTGKILRLEKRRGLCSFARGREINPEQCLSIALSGRL